MPSASTHALALTPARGLHLQPQGGDRLNSTELAHKMVGLVEEKQAEEIVLLDLRQVSIIADYFVICSATTERQTNAILESLREDLKKAGVRPLHVEGTARSGWILVDYADVIIHIFAPEQRLFYQLEELWQHASMVVKIQ
jgi:ribosome-associated protein